jgi:selenocysteine lyase/cysteine desulfurase
MAFPIDHVRGEFPSLAVADAGRRRIYLDNPAGTQVPAAVADAVHRCLIESNANLGVIGPNMTTLTYQMSRTLGRAFAPGDEIVVTCMDHEGNVSPWLQLAEDRGLIVRKVPFDAQRWQVTEEKLGAALSERTRLVALTYASNLTGAVNPVKQLVARARAAGALTFVDAVQFAPHGLIDVVDLSCDFLVCSSYKFFGPHLGILYGRRELLASLVPYKLRCSSDALPDRFETGTPQIELMAGLSAAIGYFERVGAAFGADGSRRRLPCS